MYKQTTGETNTQVRDKQMANENPGEQTQHK